MPTKSNEALAMDAIQNGVRSWLRQEGFRVRGRTFNRLTDAGFTQVIGFQMGTFDPPGTAYFPGLRENLYGQWTVNLGVYVPEVAKLTGERGPGSVVQDYHCCIRSRIGNLGPEQADVWWPLSPVEDLIAEVHYRLEAHALPFLASFESREAILRTWRDIDDYPTGGNPPRIVKAILLAELGRTEEARALLIAQVEGTEHRSHQDYVRGLAERMGLGKLEV